MGTRTSISFESSLKSLDTENWLDRKFYRPIGFQVAMSLKSTSVTPNMITIFSIFVGVAAGILFYPVNFGWNLLGVVLLVLANILDCVDGQLARITGIKSKIGRVLDGLCGEIWFLTIYIVLSLRLMNQFHWGSWVFFIALASGASHFMQASILDYYKTLHLYMLKGGVNSEFETSQTILMRTRSFSWKGKPAHRLIYTLYYVYTLNQEKRTPHLQSYLTYLRTNNPNGIPEKEIERFREKSLKMMPLLDLFTFNARSIVLFCAVLLNVGWLYFFCEIVVLNPLLLVAVSRYERMIID
ncbi:CDP-alcohol phosphatidyltransferase family protein [Microbacter margulisiae]|uniref:Phosphatidylglycerophosphate synthase n=1 Tax=Microbacter margulisiae TaxID=1350067 RepID=A0A7W5DRI9_9PORP|nr:CDP-alcohol phosphatidyltransferase family protein [Microbacter margulisiae]MBB3187239.1 phosphatidylglycerophosphate synthase [Microbacter margulisiae]